MHRGDSVSPADCTRSAAHMSVPAAPIRPDRRTMYRRDSRSAADGTRSAERTAGPAARFPAGNRTGRRRDPAPSAARRQGVALRRLCLVARSPADTRTHPALDPQSTAECRQVDERNPCRRHSKPVADCIRRGQRIRRRQRSSYQRDRNMRFETISTWTGNCRRRHFPAVSTCRARRRARQSAPGS